MNVSQEAGCSAPFWGAQGWTLSVFSSALHANALPRLYPSSHFNGISVPLFDVLLTNESQAGRGWEAGPKAWEDSSAAFRKPKFGEHCQGEAYLSLCAEMLDGVETSPQEWGVTSVERKSVIKWDQHRRDLSSKRQELAGMAEEGSSRVREKP